MRKKYIYYYAIYLMSSDVYKRLSLRRPSFLSNEGVTIHDTSQTDGTERVFLNFTLTLYYTCIYIYYIYYTRLVDKRDNMSRTGLICYVKELYIMHKSPASATLLRHCFVFSYSVKNQH